MTNFNFCEFPLFLFIYNSITIFFAIPYGPLEYTTITNSKFSKEVGGLWTISVSTTEYVV